MKGLLVSSLFLACLSGILAKDKQNDQGIEYFSIHLGNSELAFTSTNSLYIAEREAISKYESETFSLVDSASTYKVYVDYFTIIQNKASSYLLYADTDLGVSWGVKDLSLDVVDFSDRNLPGTTNQKEGYSELQKIYISGNEMYFCECNKPYYETNPLVALAIFFSVTTFNETFHFGAKSQIGRIEFKTDYFKCGQMALDKVTNELWTYVAFENQPVEGLSLYALKRSMIKLILKFPYVHKVQNVVVHDNKVVVHAAEGQEHYLYAFILPQQFNDGETVNYMSRVKRSPGFIAIHDLTGDIYFKDQYQEIFVYKIYQTNITLSNSFNLTSLDTSFYSMTFDYDQTHAYLISDMNVIRFQVPFTSMSVINLPSLLSFAFLIFLFLF